MGSIGLPNIITLARLLAVPVIIWLILAERMTPAFWIFLIAGLSDALDGYCAKRFDCETEFGRYLDPVADKALLVSVYFTLGHGGHLPVWLVILVVSRDILIIGGILLLRLLNGALEMRPLLISKINTAMQIILAGLMLYVLGIGGTDLGLVKGLTFLVAVTTIASGMAYLVLWGLGSSGMIPIGSRVVPINNQTEYLTGDVKPLKDRNR